MDEVGTPKGRQQTLTPSGDAVIYEENADETQSTLLFLQALTKDGEFVTEKDRFKDILSLWHLLSISKQSTLAASESLTDDERSLCTGDTTSKKCRRIATS